MAVSHSRRWLAGALFTLAGMLAANSMLGPLVADVIDYRMSTTLVNQLIALDVVSLAVIAPLAVLAGVLVLRGHRAGPVLAIAPAAFTAYMIAQTIVGSDYLGVPGNNERWFPWHLGLFVLGVVTLVGAWRGVDGRELPAASRRRDRWTAVALFGLAVFVAVVQWVPALADMMRDRPTRADYLSNPAMTWTLALLDLGIATPAAVAAGIGLLRGTDWGRRVAYSVVGFFALVGPAVAAMAITMQVNDDPNAAVANVAVMSAAGLALALLGVAVYRPLLRRRAAAQPRSRAGVPGTFVPSHQRPGTLIGHRQRP
jgi:hypothetical protein